MPEQTVQTLMKMPEELIPKEIWLFYPTVNVLTDLPEQTLNNCSKHMLWVISRNTRSTLLATHPAEYYQHQQVAKLGLYKFL